MLFRWEYKARGFAQMPKICERAADVKSMHKHTHTHTSTIVGKEFYWFGFYIVYAFCTWQTIAKRRVASQFTKLLLLWLLRLLLLLSNENICKMPITLWVMMGTSFSIQYICYNMDVKHDGLKCLRMWNSLGRWEGWARYAYVCICVLACLPACISLYARAIVFVKAHLCETK